jgi:hypothetical protein
VNVRSKVLLTSFVLVAGATALGLFSPPLTARNAAEQVCQWMGGKWASVRSECVTRACYAAGDCGFWLHPNEWCHDLRTGDSIVEVYFRLGNPNQVEGNTYTWLDGKPGGVPFTAIIENGVLTSVNCLPRRPARGARTLFLRYEPRSAGSPLISRAVQWRQQPSKLPNSLTGAASTDAATALRA